MFNDLLYKLYKEKHFKTFNPQEYKEPKWDIKTKEVKTGYHYIFTHTNSSFTYIGFLHNTNKISINDILNYLNNNHPTPHPEYPIRELDYDSIYIIANSVNDSEKYGAYIYKGALINVVTHYLRKKKIEEVLSTIQ